jgi:heat shock protein HslJ
MELGPTTAAFCGETSLDSQMTMMFGPAQNYGFEEDGNVLVFAWAAGGPIDYFRNAAAPAAADTNLLGKTWQWNGLTSSVLDMTVKTPANYLITFGEDGSASIQADCNLVQGSYTAVSGSLNVEMGPSTLALCPDGSLSDLYLLGLETTTGYTLQDGALALSVGQNDGVMLFTEAGTEVTVPDPDEEVDLPDPETGEATGTVTAPDGVYLRSGPGTEYPPVGTVAFGETGTIIGVSEDGQWWVVKAPNQPDGQAWVSASFVDAANTGSVPVVETPELLPTLTGNPWQWLSLTTPVETTTVADPSLYTITFNADGTAAIKADCNNATASYTSDDSAINIDTGATTLVACPEGSLDTLYLNSLINVSSYFFDAGNLYLEMPADGGTMKFASIIASEPETPEEPDAPDEETDVQLFQVTSFGPAGSEQPVLEDTQITIAFTDTEVKGNAGCNDYTGTLDRTDGAFTISNITVTNQACNEPAGINDQEQAYLTALRNTAGFSWEEKLAEDGSKIVTAGQLFYVLDGVNGIINLITP